MAKVISMFNHKGGVSKTTTTFHLAWKLAALGQKVLMIDADPQCNLTGLTLGIGDYDSLFGFYESRNNNNIYSTLAPVFGMGKGEGRSIDSFDITKVSGNKNLNLLAGHIKFAEFDMLVATAITSSSSLPMLKDLIGAFNKLIRGCAEKNDVDVVFIDMSPSISATNMCLFMSSDYFILPTFPDFYCYQAIDSLSEVLPNWANKTRTFKDTGILPKHNPKMLGVISQNYRVYGRGENQQKKMAASFQIWADKIKDITNNKLVQSLVPLEMIVDEKLFEQNVDYDSPYNLANIQDLNTLMAISQKKSKPVFDITEGDYGGGALWQHEQGGKSVGAKILIGETDKVYSNMANAVARMIGL